MQEKKKEEKRQVEYFQTQWRKHVDKLTIPPKQTPVYLAVSKGQNKEKKHKTGEDLHCSMQRKTFLWFLYNLEIGKKKKRTFISSFVFHFLHRVG